MPKSIPIVMVSSTSSDLKPHRDKAQNAILRLGWQPKMMEHDGAASEDASKRSLRFVNEADVYILILGFRYGSIPLVPENPNGLSYTELEYRHALKREGTGKLVILSFLMDKNHSRTIEQTEEDAGKKVKLDKLRAEIRDASKRGVSAFFVSEDGLYGEILDSLHKLSKSQSDWTDTRAASQMTMASPIGNHLQHISLPIPEHNLFSDTSSYTPVETNDFQYKANPQDTIGTTKNDEIISDKNLLIGLVIDLSSSMVETLDKISGTTSISKEKMNSAFTNLVEKAMSYCKTPESEEILPKFSLFVYGFGFGQLRLSLSNVFAKLGIKHNSFNRIPNSPIRDLFDEIAQKENIPINPTAAILHRYWESYKKSVEAQILDMGMGESELLATFQKVNTRFQDLLIGKQVNPILLIISNGKSNPVLDRQVSLIIENIKDMNVKIISCYIGEHQLTEHKRLYAQPLTSWTEDARRMFEFASYAFTDTDLNNSISTMLIELGWDVPKGAKMFFQVNNSDTMEDVINVLTSPLKSR